MASIAVPKAEPTSASRLKDTRMKTRFKSRPIQPLAKKATLNERFMIPPAWLRRFYSDQKKSTRVCASVDHPPTFEPVRSDTSLRAPSSLTCAVSTHELAAHNPITQFLHLVSALKIPLPDSRFRDEFDDCVVGSQFRTLPSPPLTHIGASLLPEPPTAAKAGAGLHWTYRAIECKRGFTPER